MMLNIEKSGEQDQERSEEWLVNMVPGSFLSEGAGFSYYIFIITI